MDNKTTVADVLPPELANDFTPVPDALIDHGDKLGLTASERLLAIAIWRHQRLGEAFPAIRTLMKETGLSESTVERVTKRLELRHLLVVDRSPGRCHHYDVRPLWKELARVVREEGPRQMRGGTPVNHGEVPPSITGTNEIKVNETNLKEKTTTRVPACESSPDRQSSSLTDDVVAYFYERTMATENPKNVTWFADAITDHPDVTPQEWRAVIDWRWSNPWWKDGNLHAGLVCVPGRLAEAINAVRSPASILPASSRMTGNGALLTALGAPTNYNLPETINGTAIEER
jgi:DNA-binding MarR family transcriptional regulator